MSWSLKLITVRGIPVRVHITFLLIVLWAAYVGASTSSPRGYGSWRVLLLGAAAMVLFVVLVFVCVVVHELGHSLVAQLFGVRVEDITLWPLGGVARMARLPQRPYEEFLITAAGPATNILLAIVLGIPAVLAIGGRQIVALVTTPVLMSHMWSSPEPLALLLRLALYNVILALFNLIPAFPMDGGRLLRSLLALFLPFSKATQAAAFVGQGVAVLLILASALPPGNLFMAMIGFFVFIAARQESQLTRVQNSLLGLHVRQAMQPVGPTLRPNQTLGEAAAEVAIRLQGAFLVIDEDQRLVGVLPRSDLIAAVRRAGVSAPKTKGPPPGGAGPMTTGQHMSQDYIQCHPDDALDTVQARLFGGRPGIAVVVEDDRPVGILSRNDILRLAELITSYPNALPRN